MFYIKENGINHGQPHSGRVDGDVTLPDALLVDYIDTKGFANLTVENGAVTAVEVNQEALDEYEAAHPATEETPTQKRENAYNTEALIPWEDKTLTVTEAAKLWSYYAAEGDSGTAAELTALIANAKADIRQRFPEASDP